MNKLFYYKIILFKFFFKNFIIYIKRNNKGIKK